MLSKMSNSRSPMPTGTQLESNDPVGAFQSDHWHKKIVQEATSRLSQIDYLKDTQINHYKRKQSKFDEVQQRIQKANQKRAQTQMRDLHVANTKMFIRLSAVEVRDPVYSKLHPPALPTSEVYLQQQLYNGRQVASLQNSHSFNHHVQAKLDMESKPTLNLKQRVATHRDIQKANQQMFQRLINVPSSLPIQKMEANNQKAAKLKERISRFNKDGSRKVHPLTSQMMRRNEGSIILSRGMEGRSCSEFYGKSSQKETKMFNYDASIMGNTQRDDDQALHNENGQIVDNDTEQSQNPKTSQSKGQDQQPVKTTTFQEPIENPNPKIGQSQHQLPSIRSTNDLGADRATQRKIMQSQQGILQANFFPSNKNKNPMLPYEPCIEFQRYQDFGRLPHKRSVRSHLSNHSKDSPMKERSVDKTVKISKPSNQVTSAQYVQKQNKPAQNLLSSPPKGASNIQLVSSKQNVAKRSGINPAVYPVVTKENFYTPISSQEKKL